MSRLSQQSIENLRCPGSQLQTTGTSSDGISTLHSDPSIFLSRLHPQSSACPSIRAALLAPTFRHESSNQKLSPHAFPRRSSMHSYKAAPFRHIRHIIAFLPSSSRLSALTRPRLHPKRLGVALVDHCPFKLHAKLHCIIIGLPQPCQSGSQGAPESVNFIYLYPGSVCISVTLAVTEILCDAIPRGTGDCSAGYCCCGLDSHTSGSAPGRAQSLS